MKAIEEMEEMMSEIDSQESHNGSVVQNHAVFFLRRTRRKQRVKDECVDVTRSAMAMS